MVRNDDGDELYDEHSSDEHDDDDDVFPYRIPDVENGSHHNGVWLPEHIFVVVIVIIFCRIFCLKQKIFQIK